MKCSVGRLVGMLIVLVGARQGIAGVINVGSGLGYGYNTIQAAINAASSGDTVVVAPGTYHENLTLYKSITLTSTNPHDRGVIDTTVIDGGGGRTMSVFREDAPADGPVITGFTVTGGARGGIYILGTPSYRTWGYGAPKVINNVFRGNGSDGFGAVFCDGMWGYQPSNPVIANNLFFDNTTNAGGSAVNLEGGAHALLINNTIVGNRGGDGQIFFYAGGGTTAQIVNNIVAFGDGGIAWLEGGFSAINNCVYGNANWDYYSREAGGRVTAPPGSGNISADPLFVDLASRDLRLQPGSPCIDAGYTLPTYGYFTNSWTPTVDFAGSDRVVDDPLVADTGYGGPPVIDIGAYEGAVPEPSTLIVWGVGLGAMGLLTGRRRRKQAA